MIQQLNRWYQSFIIDSQRVYLAVLLATVFAVVIFLGDMLLPVIAGIVTAYLLDDFVVFMEHKGTSRRRAIALVFLIFMALMIMVFFGIVPLLYAQMAQLVQEMPNMMEQGQSALKRLPSHYPLITPVQIEEFIQSMSLEVRDVSRLVLSYFLSALPNLITFLLYLVLLPMLVFFFLKDKRMILEWVLGYLPNERGLVIDVLQETDRKIGGYLRGKIWEMFIVGAVSSLAFIAMDLNYPLLLGSLVGLSVIVPFIGAIVVTFPVVIIAFFQWGLSAELFYLVILYGLIQALDASVLVPLLFSGAVNLHPILIIVSVLFFGGLWGFWGVFFAIPLGALVQVVLTMWPRSVAEPHPAD